MRMSYPSSSRWVAKLYLNEGVRADVFGDPRVAPLHVNSGGAARLIWGGLVETPKVLRSPSLKAIGESAILACLRRVGSACHRRHMPFPPARPPLIR